MRISSRERLCVRSGATVAALLIFASVSFAQVINYNGHPAVADEALVRLSNNNPGAFDRVRRALPQAAFEALSLPLNLYHVRWRGLPFSIWLDVLARHPDVSYAEPNYIVEAIQVPNDSNYP